MEQPARKQQQKIRDEEDKKLNSRAQYNMNGKNRWRKRRYEEGGKKSLEKYFLLSMRV